MKNWWLDLYTIPSLKKLARAFAIVLSAIILVRMFAPQILVLMAFFTMYISSVMVAESKVGLSANIEFHKLHVPYPELRKALLKDMFIRMSAICLAVCICLGVCAAESNATEAIFLAIPLGINLTVCFLTSNVNKMVNGKFRFSVYNRDHLPKLLAFGQTVLFSLVGLAFLTVVIMAGFNPLIVFGFVVFGLVLFYNIFAHKALFHLEKEKGSFKTMMKYSAKGLGTAAALFVFGIVLLRPIINDRDAGAGAQILAFDFVGPFTPELDVETAKVLLTDWEIDKAKVFKDTPGINQVPVSTLFQKPTMRDYLAYLEGVENPTTDNLLFMLKMNEKYKGDPRLKSHLSAEVVKKWPKSQKFPEEYLDKQMVKEERMPASTEAIETQN